MKKIFIAMVILFIAVSIALSQKSDSDIFQRKATGVFDFQKSTSGNFDFYISNYGIFGHNVPENKGGAFWPKTSANQYLEGAGFWFGAKKYKNSTATDLSKYVIVSYNPFTKKSWLVPGRIEDGNNVQNDLSSLYRAYFSSDFDTLSGRPLNETDGQNWALWITEPSNGMHYNSNKYVYESDNNKRNRTTYPNGPHFISDEDIFSTFKDTDLDFYEGDSSALRQEGYPLGIQVESSVFSWTNENFQDVTVLLYTLENRSSDTLWDCWFSGVYDIFITDNPGMFQSSMNDRASHYYHDASLNLAVGWTNSDRGEFGKGFGYIGIFVLESPTVNDEGFLRYQEELFKPNEQLGLVTFRNWTPEFNPNTSNARYDFMSSGIKDRDNGPGDKTMPLTTGPFNLLPGEKVRIAYGIAFAPPKGEEIQGISSSPTATNYEADGTKEDMAFVITKVRNTFKEYYKGIALSIGSNESQHIQNKIIPNPVSDWAVFNYSIQREGLVKISIIDETGRQLNILSDSFKSIGDYQIEIESSKLNLPNGLYFIKVQSIEGVSVSKFILMK